MAKKGEGANRETDENQGKVAARQGPREFLGKDGDNGDEESGEGPKDEGFVPEGQAEKEGPGAKRTAGGALGEPEKEQAARENEEVLERHRTPVEEVREKEDRIGGQQARCGSGGGRV